MKVIGVSNEVHSKYVQEVKDQLKRAGIRVEADIREEKLGYKIRESQMNKVPYVLVVGDQEMESRSVNVRKYGQKETENLKIDEFIRAVNHKITTRSLKL